MKLINISDELMSLSKEMIETIESEDKEYEFNKNKSYVERNVLASKFKKKIMGLSGSDISQLISTDDKEEM